MVHLSTASIWRVLKALDVPRLPRARQLPKPHSRRYQRAISGERVQLDTMKIALGFVQFTTMDDRT